MAAMQSIAAFGAAKRNAQGHGGGKAAGVSPGNSVRKHSGGILIPPVLTCGQNNCRDGTEPAPLAEYSRPFLRFLFILLHSLTHKIFSGTDTLQSSTLRPLIFHKRSTPRPSSNGRGAFHSMRQIGKQSIRPAPSHASFLPRACAPELTESRRTFLSTNLLP